MKHFDAAVIGAGVLGCFAARNLRRWKISTVLIEAAEDVCTGITRANSAIVYAGYDNKEGSLKAQMTVRGNAAFDTLCQELDVPFSRCGSLLVSYDPNANRRLEKKLRQGIRNGVPGLRLLSGPEAQAMEPMLKAGVTGALYAPSTGTVNPWQLGIAAFENAVDNGVVPMLNNEVTHITCENGHYIIRTNQETITCNVILNCAGLHADQVQEMLFPPSVRLVPDSAEYMVLDTAAQKPKHIIFHQAQSCGKGITAIPCTEGNLLLSGIRTPLNRPFATTMEGIQALQHDAKDLLPDIDLTQVIRSFGAVRPNPYLESGDSLHDFCILNPGPGFYSLIGIKTPGLTCSNELGLYLATRASEFLKAEENKMFNPRRKAISGKDHEIICQCQRVTRAEVLEAINRGAVTVDGVKRRVGAGMGRCQGSRCAWKIAKILKETGANPNPLF